MAFDDWFRSVWFKLIYAHNLIYNACWEDPRVDRLALNLGPEDTLLVITSAGCNVLDYALLAPKHIYAIEDCVETVFTRLPFWDNYFWRLYMCGAYTPDCCPEYLKRVNFEKLKAGLAERISVHTSSLLHFLRTHDVNISRFVMLDHMDWLSTANYPVLQQEWQAFIRRAAPETRLIWRSGGFLVDYINPIAVTVAGRQYRVGDLLTYQDSLAAQLHAQDRVHTYGSFYVADLAAL